MKRLDVSVEHLLSALFELSKEENVSLLDSCGVTLQDSQLLIAGIRPLETFRISDPDPNKSLAIIDRIRPDAVGIFTISYEFGLKLENIDPRVKEFESFPEPDIFLSVYDCLIIHNYTSGETLLTGNEKRFTEIELLIKSKKGLWRPKASLFAENPLISANFTCESYLQTVEKIKEAIRRGDTYQANLTQQVRARLPAALTPARLFSQLRHSHPAAFSAFLKRDDDFVVSISPERLLKISQNSRGESRISVSPVKGTRPRGSNAAEDRRLKNELVGSEKDRAENIMIVDLLRNDIGKISKFGSVQVQKLCQVERHPTLFHLVSTITGDLQEDLTFSEIIRAVFPSGSITGAPKIRTMRIIDQIETADRGLSMGAIGYITSSPRFRLPNSLDLSVAIRTMVIRCDEAIFNVGGGIVIDSIPEMEYEECLWKAEAILKAITGGTKFDKFN